MSRGEDVTDTEREQRIETPLGNGASAGIQWQVLAAAAISEGEDHPPGSVEIRDELAAAGVDLNKQSIRDQLNRLENKRYIAAETGRHPQHQLALVYLLTEQGERVLRKQADWWAEVIEGLATGEVDTVSVDRGGGEQSADLDRAIREVGLAGDGGDRS
jgi:DNA-binding PadR family transcriptional regulator